MEDQRTDESTVIKDSLVPLTCHNPSNLGQEIIITCRGSMILMQIFRKEHILSFCQIELFSNDLCLNILTSSKRKTCVVSKPVNDKASFYNKLFTRYSLVALRHLAMPASKFCIKRKTVVHICKIIKISQNQSCRLNICYQQTNNDSQWNQAYEK